MDLSREDIRRQLELEAESRSLGEARYSKARPMPWKTGDAAATAEEEANLPPGQHLIRLAVLPAADAIREWVAAANEGKAGRRHSALKWMELANPEEVAYLAARVALNASATRATLQTAAIHAGTAIIDHVDMVTFHGKNAAGYHGLTKKSRFATGSARRMAAVRKMLEKEGSRTVIAPIEKTQLGLVALHLLMDATGLFELDTMLRGNGRAYYLRPTEAVRSWLTRQHERSALLEPLYMPMVVRPRRWRNPYAGGYLRPTPRSYGLVKNFDRDYREQLRYADLPLVYEAINHIQETPWRINRRVLDVMRQAWAEGGNIAGLPPFHDRPLPARPDVDDVEDERLKAWRRAASKVHEANAHLFSQRLSLQQRLWMADKFVDEPAIWFPHAMDFRGRVYPSAATAMHPQADDGGKALLEFAHGLPLGKSGAYWLAVHIANLFGVDKVDFKERVAWTYAHSSQLIDSALDPLNGGRFWATADSPWLALAAAFEFVAYLQQGESYVSHLPVPLDGSNSGLQHYSAMLRDPTGAAAVNLLPSDEPSDIYRQVAEWAQRMVDADPDPRAAPWRGGKVTRTIAKRPTMTYVYSATRFGMQDMVLKTLRELDAESAEPFLGGADNYDAAGYLSHVLFKAVGEVAKAAEKAMAWLRKVAKVAADANVPLVWTTPDGLPVKQDYRVPHGQRLSVHWKGQRLRLFLNVDSKTVDARGQANGIAPNFVHSLDAAHLRAVARAAKGAGIDHLAVIHDSFATHAARTDELSRLLRDTFVEQYREDVLGRFRDEVVAALPDAWKDQVPPPPAPGDLDLEQVRHSSYLFG